MEIFCHKIYKKKIIDKTHESQGATEGKNPMSDMHPITRAEKDVLFDGFSKDEKGRSKYLKMRKKFDPEEKYRYPQLSSWEYGWNFKHITTPGMTWSQRRPFPSHLFQFCHLYALQTYVFISGPQVLPLSMPEIASSPSLSTDRRASNTLRIQRACEIRAVRSTMEAFYKAIAFLFY